MTCRHYALSFLLVLILNSVSGASLVPADDSLRPVAELLSRKEFAAARSGARNARPSPQRDLVLGISAYRLEEWSAAERDLAAVADTLPLLGDFALYYRASALSNLSRTDEVVPLLDRLRRDYPDSPLLRAGTLLEADTLYETGRYTEALNAYQRFIDTYPTGNDTLKALLSAALCREHLGDPTGAVTALRTIWLTYPAKAVAGQAAGELDRLKAAGTPVAPYSAEELFKRGAALFDQRHYRQAATALTEISADDLPEQVRGHFAHKQALALYRAKMTPDAEAAFRKLAGQESSFPEYSREAAYWLAHIHDRTGRKDEAVAAFLDLAATAPTADLADDALLQAAFIRKSAGQRQQALELFRRLAGEYPASPHRSRALWETGWLSHLSGDHAAAREAFQQLTSDSVYRERALYWLGRSLQASGTADAAAAPFTVLREEYPAGYYSLTIEQETGMRGNRIPTLDKGILASIPAPHGFERTKALLALGLREEAAMELAACRRRDGAAFSNSVEHARLYLAMDNYQAAMGLIQRSQLKRNAPLTWAVLYPAGFHEIVSRYCTASNVEESLAFALIKAESSFSPAVRSPVGAIGLMQLMPATARETAKNLGETLNITTLTTPEVNVRLGTRHLKELFQRFDGNVVNVIAAYNAGSSPVHRWRKAFGHLREDEFIENIPYPETREYVKKVLAGREVYRRLYTTGATPGTVQSLPEPERQQTAVRGE